MFIIIRVGYQDSRALEFNAEEIPAYMEMLERAFPGDWSIRPMPKPEEVVPAAEEIDDEITSHFLKDPEDF